MTVQIHRQVMGRNVDHGKYKVGRMNSQRVEVTVGCPRCGTPHSLADHRIEDDGTVLPSVECSNTNCTFHDQIVLIGWTPDAI